MTQLSIVEILCHPAALVFLEDERRLGHVCTLVWSRGRVRAGVVYEQVAQGGAGAGCIVPDLDPEANIVGATPVRVTA